MPHAGRLRRRSLLSATTAVTALGAFALTAPPANATETNVPCDAAALVTAVTAANASSDADILSLAPNCVYTLTSIADTTSAAGLPAIRSKLTVNGNHATIARAKDAPQFRIISNWDDLALNEVTVTGGHAPDGIGTNSSGDGKAGGSGGGIETWGPLTITDSVVTGNTAGAGSPGIDGTTAVPRPGDGGFGGSGGGVSSYGPDSVALTITNTLIIANTSGPGARGGNGAGNKAGGFGGFGGFGGGLDLSRGTALRITSSTISGNLGADGGRGGTGGPDGGRGGSGGRGGIGAGVNTSTKQSELLSPVIVKTEITGNRAGNGGDAGVAGPSGYPGQAGYGGNGGGLGVFHDTITFDGGTVRDNAAGEPGTGLYPYPSGGGIYTNNGRVTLTNGAVVSGNRPDNCYSVADVPGCVNDPRALGIQRIRESAAQDDQAEELAAAARAVPAAMSPR